MDARAGNATIVLQTAPRAAPLINGSKNGHVCYSTSVSAFHLALSLMLKLSISLSLVRRNDRPGTFAALKRDFHLRSVTTSVQLSSDSLFAKSDGRPLATHQRHLTRRLLSSAQSRRRIVFAFSAALAAASSALNARPRIKCFRLNVSRHL